MELLFISNRSSFQQILTAFVTDITRKNNLL